MCHRKITIAACSCVLRNHKLCPHSQYVIADGETPDIATQGDYESHHQESAASTNGDDQTPQPKNATITSQGDTTDSITANQKNTGTPTVTISISTPPPSPKSPSCSGSGSGSETPTPTPTPTPGALPLGLSLSLNASASSFAPSPSPLGQSHSPLGQGQRQTSTSSLTSNLNAFNQITSIGASSIGATSSSPAIHAPLAVSTPSPGPQLYGQWPFGVPVYYYTEVVNGHAYRMVAPMVPAGSSAGGGSTGQSTTAVGTAVRKASAGAVAAAPSAAKVTSSKAVAGKAVTASTGSTGTTGTTGSTGSTTGTTASGNNGGTATGTTNGTTSTGTGTGTGTGTTHTTTARSSTSTAKNAPTITLTPSLPSSTSSSLTLHTPPPLPTGYYPRPPHSPQCHTSWDEFSIKWIDCVAFHSTHLFDLDHMTDEEKEQEYRDCPEYFGDQDVYELRLGLCGECEGCHYEDAARGKVQGVGLLEWGRLMAVANSAVGELGGGGLGGGKKIGHGLGKRSSDGNDGGQGQTGNQTSNQEKQTETEDQEIENSKSKTQLTQTKRPEEETKRQPQKQTHQNMKSQQKAQVEAHDHDQSYQTQSQPKPNQTPGQQKTPQDTTYDFFAAPYKNQLSDHQPAPTYSPFIPSTQPPLWFPVATTPIPSYPTMPHLFQSVQQPHVQQQHPPQFINNDPNYNSTPPMEYSHPWAMNGLFVHRTRPRMGQMVQQAQGHNQQGVLGQNQLGRNRQGIEFQQRKSHRNQPQARTHQVRQRRSNQQGKQSKQSKQCKQCKQSKQDKQCKQCKQGKQGKQAQNSHDQKPHKDNGQAQAQTQAQAQAHQGEKLFLDPTPAEAQTKTQTNGPNGESYNSWKTLTRTKGLTLTQTSEPGARTETQPTTDPDISVVGQGEQSTTTNGIEAKEMPDKGMPPRKKISKKTVVMRIAIGMISP